jgi:large subunit ribosomal protein L29
MKANDLRSKDKQALQEELIALTREKFNLRMQQGTGQLANPARFLKVKRLIARIKTILNAKQGG